MLLNLEQKTSTNLLKKRIQTALRNPPPWSRHYFPHSQRSVHFKEDSGRVPALSLRRSSD
jgi:hypothetical protein